MRILGDTKGWLEVKELGNAYEDILLTPHILPVNYPPMKTNDGWTVNLIRRR